MKREIIVNSSMVETRVAVLEDGVLVELLIDDSKNKSVAGNIYKGRVLKILPGMQAAFVDLGLAKDAFLYVRDIFEDLEEGERARLKHIVEEINPQREGVIVRTAGIGKGKAEIGADLEFLRSLWKKIKTKAETLTAPALVQKDLDLIFRIFRDLFTKEVVRLVVDSPTEYERCLEYAESLHSDIKSLLFLYTEDEPIFRSFGIEREIEKALRHKVWLKSGGYIVLEETEALVSIDINTGKYVGKHDFEETILKTNLEAAREIARQVRLRDLGGIIIIDFIDMARQESRDRVVQELKDALKADRSPTNVSLLSDLGLVEMTRKRVRQGLNRALSASCPACGGLGFIRSTPSIAHQVLREAEWRLCRKRIPRIRIRG